MPRDPIVRAKAENIESRSDGIVVSFGAGSYRALKARTFSSVIRKRVPTSFRPRWLYFHINVPCSSVCARAELLRVELISATEAIALSRSLDLPEAEILAYLGGANAVGCYRLGRIQHAAPEAKADKIREHMIYHPPQSYFVLSKEGKAILDRLAGFSGRA